MYHKKLHKLKFFFISGCLTLLSTFFGPLTPLQADNLVMKNGDRLTGKIWRASKKIILLETPYGVFRVPRSQVRELEYNELTNRPVVVFLKNGQKLDSVLLDWNATRVRIQNGSNSRLLLWKNILHLSFTTKNAGP